MNEKRETTISRRQMIQLAVTGGGAFAVNGAKLVDAAQGGNLPAVARPDRSVQPVSKLSRTVLYYGKTDTLPQPIKLQAGPVSMILEPDLGLLRYVRLGDQELLRGVYAAVRDRNWGTILPSISNLKLESSQDSFRLSFDVVCKQREIDFFWKGQIVGDSAGTVKFSFDGSPRSTFLRNRIGFCVLHPIRECAGKPCTVRKADGTEERGKFPSFISPHQPFKGIKAISHEVLPGLLAEVEFQGDTFEMEDHRNWTDANYKTYCTPLEAPYPVEVKEGSKIVQSITLMLKGQTSSRLPHAGLSPSEVVLSAEDKGPFQLPQIGLSSANNNGPLSQREIARLKALKLTHLRVDLNLSAQNWEEVLRKANKEATAIGVPLEAALLLTDAAEQELDRLGNELQSIKPQVSRWLIFHKAEPSTSEKWVQIARRRLSTFDPKVKIGSGTNAYFTELNRGRPPIAVLDSICYSINPQVHAFDNASLVENLEAQASTVDSARQFIGNRTLAITPVTLRPRSNPNATGPEAAPGPGELPPTVDPRQMSLFGAGWTLGSLKYLAQSGVQSITYFETNGWRGVMEAEAGSPLPKLFHSIPGAVFPLYHVLADAGEFSGAEVIPVSSGAPLKIEGLILRKARRVRILLANLGPDTQSVRLNCSSLPQYVRVKRLDETNAEEAMRSPESYRAAPGLLQQTAKNQLALSLLPYSVCRIDSAQPVQQVEPS